MVFVELTPIARTAVSDEVYGRLVNEILTGGLAADAALPSERELALAFGVNRHAVREALKRLQQSGLIRISHGGKTRILNWRRSVGLDALSALVAAGVVPPRMVMRDVAMMRRTVGADAARLCATEADAEQRRDILAAAANYGAGDDIAADRTFWAAIIDGSHNLAYGLALNTLVSAIDDIGATLIDELASVEISDRAAHLALADLIAAGDADGAYRQADELLTHLVTALNVTAPNQE